MMVHAGASANGGSGASGIAAGGANASANAGLIASTSRSTLASPWTVPSEAMSCLCSIASTSAATPKSSKPSKHHAAASAASVSFGSSSSVSTSSRRCPACVQKALQPYLQRHQQAQRDHAIARQECTKQLQHSQLHPFADFQAESSVLRDRLHALRSQCAAKAVRVAAQAAQNDERHTFAAAASPRPYLHHLVDMEGSVLQGGMQQSIQSQMNQIRMLRLLWTRKVFQMHRLDIDESQKQEHRQYAAQDQRARPSRARGIGKIGGLPLPHAGPELYGVLPPQELQSALRLVASLTCTAARCLGILLPHPILLVNDDAGGAAPHTPNTHAQPDIIATARARDGSTSATNNRGNANAPRQQQQQLQQKQHAQFQASSASSLSAAAMAAASSSTASAANLLSYVGGSLLKKSAKSALAYATGRTVSSTTGGSVATSQGLGSSSRHSQDGNVMSPSSGHTAVDTQAVSSQIQRSRAAILAEDTSSRCQQFALSTSRSSLSSSSSSQEDFAVALQLLQNDIIALCIRAGVPADQLYPAAAVLLNLHALEVHCQEQSAAPY